MTYTTIAAVAAVLPLAYQLAIDWIPLSPWNDIAAKTIKERTLEPLLNYGPLLIIAYAELHPSPIGLLWSMIGSFLFLLGHLNAWWRPYFFGATEKERHEYRRQFSCTLKVLPAIKDHPIPDAEHMVLGALILILCGTTTLSYTAHC